MLEVYKGHHCFIISNTFYYNVKYKTITKCFLCTNVQNSRLYYIFLAINKKSLFRVTHSIQKYECLI